MGVKRSRCPSYFDALPFVFKVLPVVGCIRRLRNHGCGRLGRTSTRETPSVGRPTEIEVRARILVSKMVLVYLYEHK